MQRIYLDHNGTTPLDPAVLEAMMPYLKGTWGNPSSTSWFGQEARRGLDRARREVADLLGAQPAEVIFCSGGTEACNLAIFGVVEAAGARHVITSAIEHQAVLGPCAHLEERGCRVSILPVDRHGVVDPEALIDVLDDEPTLVSVMFANNITGSIQPVREIARIAHEHGAVVHTDAIQAVGKIAVDVDDLGVDLLSLSAHKLYGPKGAGALYVRGGQRIAQLIHGGGQERRRRAGTENVAGLVGLGAACRLAAARLGDDSPRIARLRDGLEARVLAAVPGASALGRLDHRVPNTLDVMLPGLDGMLVMMNLDALGIATSHGSACSAGAIGAPTALLAMGLSEYEASSTVRLSLGRSTTAEEVEQVADALVEVASRLREALGRTGSGGG